MPPSVAPTFGVAISNLKLVFTPQMLFVVFTFLFMDFFDTAGTILAVGSKVGLLKSDGSIENGSLYGVSLWVAYYNFLRPHPYNYWKPLNELDILSNAGNMPAKWQLLIYLGQETILNMQKNSAS